MSPRGANAYTPFFAYVNSVSEIKIATSSEAGTMSSSPERPPRISGDIPPASEDANAPPSDAASITAAYVPKLETNGKLPTQLPAPFGRYQLQQLLGQGG